MTSNALKSIDEIKAGKLYKQVYQLSLNIFNEKIYSEISKIVTTIKPNKPFLILEKQVIFESYIVGRDIKKRKKVRIKVLTDQGSVGYMTLDPYFVLRSIQHYNSSSLLQPNAE